MFSGGTAYIETGGTEPVEIQVYDRSGLPLTGKTNIKLRVRRVDGMYYDWADNLFKAYGSVTRLLEPLTEISATQSPGVYRLNTASHVGGFDTSQVGNLVGNDILQFTVVQDGSSDASGLPTGFELKIGAFLDTILRVVALQKENYVIDTMSYNSVGLMTSARVRLFSTKSAAAAATDGGAGEGEFATYTFTSVPNATPGLEHQPTSVKSVRDA